MQYRPLGRTGMSVSEIGYGAWLETIQALKDAGTIRAFGVSINDLQPENALKLIATCTVDTVQVIYNAFHQQPEEHLLPACAEGGVSTNPHDLKDTHVR